MPVARLDWCLNDSRAESSQRWCQREIMGQRSQGPHSEMSSVGGFLSGSVASFCFQRNNCGHGFVHRLKGAKKVEGRVDGWWLTSPSGMVVAGQARKSGSGGVMLHSAYVLKVGHQA